MFQNFLRPNLDILFVGLNPAPNSWNNGHYFSSQGCFLWSYLYEAGLITAVPPLLTADEQIFAGTELNYKNWNFGIIDFCPEIIEADSKKVHPTFTHFEVFAKEIRRTSPRAVVCMHRKVSQEINKYTKAISNCNCNIGNVGPILSDCPSVFFFSYFPSFYWKNGCVSTWTSVREWLDNS